MFTPEELDPMLKALGAKAQAEAPTTLCALTALQVMVLNHISNLLEKKE